MYLPLELVLDDEPATPTVAHHCLLPQVMGRYIFLVAIASIWVPTAVNWGWRGNRAITVAQTANWRCGRDQLILKATALVLAIQAIGRH